MNDYFTALMRLAGPSTDAPAARAMQTAQSPSIESTGRELDLEQVVEIESRGLADPVPNAVDPKQGSAPLADAVTHAQRPASIASPEATLATESAGRERVDEAVFARATPPDATTAPERREADVHPVVRAAIDWVRADPETTVLRAPVERVPDTTTVSPTVRAPAPAAPDVSRAQRSSRQEQLLRDADMQRDAGRIDRRVADQSRVRRESQADLLSPEDRDADFPTSRRPASAQQGDSVVELSIGTIHVSIDAPGWSVASLPVAPPVLPASSPNAAPNSAGDARSFSRRRLPRI